MIATVAPAPPNTEAFLQVTEIIKRYPGVVALKGVSLGVRPGTVHALVGENGAGKSTLVKVITGGTIPDSGMVRLGEVQLAGLTPKRSRELGVSVIPQHRQIAFDLSVTENVVLGNVPLSRFGTIDWREAKREARRRMDRLGLDVRLDRRISDLSVGELQSLEIARALQHHVRLVLMDEPTSALSGAEVKRLFAAIRSLRDDGIAVVYISHHLEEIFEIADEVSVLRDGQRVFTGPVAGLTGNKLISLMLGREAQPRPSRAAARSAQRGALLAAEKVSTPPSLRDVSVEAFAGEILCVTGAVGSGRRELARCLSGIQPPHRGIVSVDGRLIGNPRDAVRAGVVFIPEDRQRDGLLMELDVLDNISVGTLFTRANPFYAPSREAKRAAALVKQLRVRTPSLRTPVRLLSGGNQQKVLLCRWLNSGARVFVFDEPTAGIDIGSKMEIYELLRRLADEGVAIVLFSSDFEEIRLTSDRVLVLYRGEIAGELTRNEVTDDRLLQLSLGVGK